MCGAEKCWDEVRGAEICRVERCSEKCCVEAAKFDAPREAKCSDGALEEKAERVEEPQLRSTAPPRFSKLLLKLLL
jgi:hypothetical protein